LILDDRALHAHVAELYEAVLEPERLKVLAPALWRSLGSEQGSLLVTEMPSVRVLDQVAASENIDAQAAADYDAYYFDKNTWYLHAGHLRPPFVVRGEELVEADTFERSEFYADWCARVGIYHMLGGAHPIRDGVMMFSALYRPRSASAFSAQDKGRFGIVLRHLGQVLRLADRMGTLRRERDVGLALLEALELGVMLLDASCRPLFVNRVAERALRGARWFIGGAHGVLPARQAEAREFERLVGEASRAGDGGVSAGGVLRLPDADGEFLPVMVAPVRFGPERPGLARASAVVLFADPDALPDLDPASVGAAFGLTPTEGAIVAALATGKTLVQYADDADVSVNTAKSQLAAIFDKTGHSRQSGLVAEAAAHPVVQLARRRRGAI
jgi:DNA-binding CsgD family transcriptional regulator